MQDKLSPWADHLTALAELPNVAVKLSGLVTEADWKAWTRTDVAPYAAHLLDTFGTDRVMIGSDWPVCELAGGYDADWALATELCSDLDATERAAVFGDTARRWYHLQPTDSAAGGPGDLGR